ncbi:MAG: heme-dependent oxidative N-demethylase subunit alpha family protein [Myxococcota bacterium]
MPRRVRYAPFCDRRVHRGVYNFAWWVPNSEQEEDQDLAILQDAGNASDYRTAKQEARGDGSPTIGGGFTEPLRAEVRRTLLSQLGKEEAQRLREKDLDPLLMALQPDLAVVKLDRTGSKPRDWLCYLHVWLPSGWKPEEARDKSFCEIHEHVPIVKPEHREVGAAVFANLLTTREPTTRYRFVWGLQTHPKLDCHPVRTPRPGFNGEDLWLRVERQILLPLREHDALIFLIHPYVDLVENLTTEQGKSLLAAVRDMESKGDDVLEYKFGAGYEDEYPRIEAFLQARFGERSD